MENENDIALLPPPAQTETPPPAEAEGAPPDEKTDTTSENGAAPRTAETAASTEEPTPTEGKSGNVLRYAARAGAVLLGGFAVLMLTAAAIDGIAGLAEKGLGAMALGEVFGGVSNVSTLVPSDLDGTTDTEFSEETDENTSAETAAPFISPPANEHEDGTETSSADTPQPSESAADTPSSPQTVEIVTADLSASGNHGSALINETPYQVTLNPESPGAIPDLASLYATYGADAPVVLILHTHGTESYAADGASQTTESEYRSLDPTENMIAVGRVLAETLQAAGINVIHCEVLFDAEDFSMAYYNASLAIRRYLAEYPSISYIFDLHRDSIPTADGGETVRPVTEIDGESYAQVMLVVGTDYGGSGHVGWADNFNLACKIQAAADKSLPSLMRPINLRSASFNQQYTKGSLLLEMGAVGSSLEEACRTAKRLGEILAREIIGVPEVTPLIRHEGVGEAVTLQ